MHIIHHIIGGDRRTVVVALPSFLAMKKKKRDEGVGVGSRDRLGGPGPSCPVLSWRRQALAPHTYSGGRHIYIACCPAVPPPPVVTYI